MSGCDECLQEDCSHVCHSLCHGSLLLSPVSAEVSCSSTSYLTLARDPCMVEKLQRMFNDSHVVCDMECASYEKKTKKEAVENLSLTADNVVI